MTWNVEKLKNVWERPWQIKSSSKKNLRRDWIWLIRDKATLNPLTFPLASTDVEINKCRPHLCLLLCTGVIFSLSHWENIGWGCSGCWRRYLELRRRKQLEAIKLHSEELHDWYCWPNIVRVMKSRGMQWAGLVARMGRGEKYVQGCGGDAWRKETTCKIYV